MNNTNYKFLEKGFFSWTGNTAYWQDGVTPAVFYLLSGLFILAFLLIWLFKRQIKTSYDNSQSWFKKNETLTLQIVGAGILLFAILRIVMLISRNYPNMWEIIPLHLCRLTLFLTAFVLIFKKSEYLKYISIVQIGGGLVALLYPDFKFNYTFIENAIFNGVDKGPGDVVSFYLGWDNFFFIDYLLAHGFAILAPLVILIIKPMKFSVKDMLISYGLFTGILISVFFINWISYTYSTSPYWKSNYFYTGKDDVNNLSNMFGVLSHWPFNVFTFIIFGSLYLLIGTAFLLLQDYIYFNKEENGKWVFRFQKSQHAEYFRKSWWELIKKPEPVRKTIKSE
ncbi:YwaF family protein [Mycoplasmopsis alligatoris]|uniref:Integral membrane protein n=1 Tax=Mycoplasmopsis alligatoris A21JP2 TaxID=747682 RepID=D4XWM6_9BACT|nr:YwaF family protein [Mycoplasmopsis alligatoris]EFF41203.1 integral membrane protein [Mycoplasmopsis alligatoris A21JP2]